MTLATDTSSDADEPPWRPTLTTSAAIALHATVAVDFIARPGRWRRQLAALGAGHLALLGTCLMPRSSLLGDNLCRLPAAHRQRRRVALTFDDGPDPEVTPKVLDLLDEYGARASFFCIGRRAERHPELVREIVARGHRIENHTLHHHNWFACRFYRYQLAEVQRAQRILTELAGRPPRYFRPPAGIRNPFLDPVLHRLNLRLASWTCRGFDTADGNAGRVKQRIEAASAGDIVLLHDGNAARATTGRPVVLEVLPGWLAELARRDLQIVPIPEPDDSGGAHRL